MARGKAPAGTYDYIVVGGGSAGCAVAGRLAESSRRSVLLLEAGPSDRSPFVHVPAGSLRLRDKHWQYFDQPDATRGNRSIPWMAGRILGGSSSVNGMIWVRGNPAYDGWAELGCEGWSWEEMLPVFRRAESFEDGASAVRGGAGPTSVVRSRSDHPLTDAFIESAELSGLGFNPDYNGVEQEGVALCQVNQRRGLRHSAARAYLPLGRRGDLTVVTGTTVESVVIEAGRATGVRFRAGGEARTVSADREVILSAGALGSPKLLMLSGVGPADALRGHGIEVRAELAGVGANLQEHLITAMIWNTTVPTHNRELDLRGVVRHGLDFALRGRGAVTATWSAAVFDRLDAAARTPQVELLFGAFGMVGPDAGDTGGEVLESGGEHDVSRMRMLDRSGVTVIAQILHPRARGRVELASADPAEGPVIRHRLLESSEDLGELRAACKLARRVLTTPPLADLVRGEALPGSGVNTDAEWDDYLEGAVWGAQHPAGTCKMGVGEGAVVDPHLRVRGLKGLRVADASIMPLLPSGNTNAPAIAIGEKAALLIAADEPA